MTFSIIFKERKKKSNENVNQLLRKMIRAFSDYFSTVLIFLVTIKSSIRLFQKSGFP